MANWFERIIKHPERLDPNLNKNPISTVRQIIAGSFYKVSDLRGATDLSTIRTQIDTMRALAEDSQVSTALSYYATDATTPNANGDIMWATCLDDKKSEVADIINAKIKEWKINQYARDHILELATVGNLYIPSTERYRESVSKVDVSGVALDSNSIPEYDYEILPAYALPPEQVIHLWYQGKPAGFIIDEDDNYSSVLTRFPESSIIHFSLGGLLGNYSITARNKEGEEVEYDIQFGSPLMDKAVQPTQTLNLLEDASVLSSLNRIIKFVNVECGNAEEEEIQQTLADIKATIEQQLSLNTATGDAQSFVNPQSPNNLIYVPKINGTDPISITDLNMTEASDADNKLLEYYLNKKLSVLGIPKEAMNFSSPEGLGGAGSVMSQRSQLYANALQRLETAYMQGWKDAFNQYFIARNLNDYVDSFELHMNPIVTQLSTVTFERRDSALAQATAVSELMKGLGVTDKSRYTTAVTEVLSEALPKTSSDVANWEIDTTQPEEGGMM